MNKTTQSDDTALTLHEEYQSGNNTWLDLAFLMFRPFMKNINHEQDTMVRHDNFDSSYWIFIYKLINKMTEADVTALIFQDEYKVN